MTYTYVLSTSIGKVRALVPDRVEPAEFTDEEIEFYLSQESDSVPAAAALALETLASQLGGVTRRKVADSETQWNPADMLKRAALLRDQAAAATEDPDGQVDWAELTVDDFSRRARIDAEWLRSAV